MSDTKQPNMYETFNKDIWENRVDVEDATLDALLVDHHERQTIVIKQMMERSTDGLEDELGGMLLNAQSDWYVEPTKNFYSVLNKLSKGFKLPVETIAGYFKDDGYVGQDLKNVLANPEEKPETYPNRILNNSTAMFIAGIATFLPEDIWERNNDFKELKLGISFAGDFAYNQDVMEQQSTPLSLLAIAQKLARVLPVVSDTLKENKQHNLAVIADCFAARSQIAADDILQQFLEDKEIVPSQVATVSSTSKPNLTIV